MYSIPRPIKHTRISRQNNQNKARFLLERADGKTSPFLSFLPPRARSRIILSASHKGKAQSPMLLLNYRPGVPFKGSQTPCVLIFTPRKEIKKERKEERKRDAQHNPRCIRGYFRRYKFIVNRGVCIMQPIYTHRDLRSVLHTARIAFWNNNRAFYSRLVREINSSFG